MTLPDGQLLRQLVFQTAQRHTQQFRQWKQVLDEVFADLESNEERAKLAEQTPDLATDFEQLTGEENEAGREQFAHGLATAEALLFALGRLGLLKSP